MRAGLALLAPLLAAAAVAGSDGTILPAAGAVSGFEPVGQARVFTESALYGHIDGGAEIFFEFGFEEVTVQRYASHRSAIDIELYRMTDPTAALGIYLQKCGDRCEPPAAHQGFPRYTTWGRAQLMFVDDRFLAIITADNADAQTAAAMPAFASDVTKRLPPDRPIEPGVLLPSGWTAGSVRLIRGPLALQAIITLGEGDVLRLGGRLTAAAAEYNDAPGRPAHTLVVAEYPDEGAARAAFAHLRANLDAEIRVLREAASSFVFRDYAGRFGVAGTDTRRLTLRLNLANDPGPMP